jgi:hypothetical protein
VPPSNRSNGYLLDRELQRSGKSFTGVGGGISIEDQALVESMDPIVDRRKEHLVSTDSTVVRFRRRMIESAFALADGVPAPGVDQPELWSRLAAGHVRLPEDSNLTDAVDVLGRQFEEGLDEDWPTPLLEREFRR